MAKKTITIRYKKSKIACSQDQRDTIRGLGLRRLQQERTLEIGRAHV